MTDDPITSYLSALKIELKLNSVLGARVLDEAEDHLRAASEELVASGLSPAEAGEVAVIRFGGAATVARAFAEGAAGSAARNATKWAFASFVVYVAAATAVAMAAPRHLLDFPQGLPTWFGLQIAIVALAVLSARWLRWRREPLVPAEASAPLAAGAGIATGALALSAAGEVLLAVTRPAGGWQAGEMEAVIFIAGALLTLAAAVICVAAAARTRTVAALPTERRRTDRLATLIADLGNLSPRLGRAAARVLSRPRLTAVVVAAGACLAATLMQALSDDVAHHGSVLVGAGAVGMLEAVAVVTYYLLFGRSLGLRPGRTQAAR